MTISLDHVTKRYDGRQIIHPITLTVSDGELFVLLGPSGSGKSTLLRMIGGLVTADAGHIHLRGQDVTHLPPQRRGVGFVFQNYALFQHMTVAENIEFGLRVQHATRRERQRRRDELLEIVGLAGFGHRLPRQLSGGQQQRVALARALAPRPSVLLLDEPFGALDARIRLEMRGSLRSIQRDLGITAIFVTHDQEEAFALGDRLGVMHAGRLLEVGPPEELYLRPETEFVATFLGSANLLVGSANSTGVAIGNVEFPMQTIANPTSQQRRVQVLFRPEDTRLAPISAELGALSLGEATVEQTTFVGSHERVRLQLPPIQGVRSISPVVPFGADYLPIEVTRSQHEARAYPLIAGDRTWLGVLRVHALLHPGLRVLLGLSAAAIGQNALAAGLELIRHAQAHATVLGAGFDEAALWAALHQADHGAGSLPGVDVRATPDALLPAIVQDVTREPYDLVMLSAPPAPDLLEQVLAVGEHHVLLVPRGCEHVPNTALVCVARNETSKSVVEFVGRLFRHLGTQVTLLTAIEARAPDGTERDYQRAEQFLDASSRSLAAMGVQARQVISAKPVREAIQHEMATGGHEWLVLGAPLHPLHEARIRPFLLGPVSFPVLLARPPHAMVEPNGFSEQAMLREESVP